MSGRDGSTRSWNAGWKAGYRFRQGEKKAAHRQAEADRDQYRRELERCREQLAEAEDRIALLALGPDLLAHIDNMEAE